MKTNSSTLSYVMYRFTILFATLLAFSSCGNSAPEKRVHRLLTDRMQTLSLAESCTGGTLAARLTAMPGASAYFKCGVVAYSLNSNYDLLGLSCDTVARYGMVSEPVVRQMAEGVRHAVNTYYSIATTGIAGPTGGTPETPIGMVWIAVSSPSRTVTKVIHAEGDRNRIIREAGNAAIALLEEEIYRENDSMSVR